MTNWRYVRISLIVLFVVVPTVLGALAGSGAVNQAAGAAGDTWIITASAGPGGSITPEGALTVNDGDTPTFTITPADNYHIANVVVDDSTSVGAVPSYTFDPVTANHTITATFAIDTYTLSVPVVGSGTVAKTPNQPTYDYGTSVQLTASRATGWSFVGWTGDASGSANPLTVTMNAAKSITATFAINTYTLTHTPVLNGIILPASPVTVSYGGSQTFTIAPTTAGYHIANVVIDDNTSVGAVPSYAFTNVTGNHTISASFAINTYTITATAGLHGAISPTVQTVDYHTTPTFTITPVTGYHVADVVVDGVSVGALTSYTFPAVSADHKISASFAINTYTITPSAGLNGAISPAAVQTVNYGATRTFTTSAATGYYASPTWSSTASR